MKNKLPIIAFILGFFIVAAVTSVVVFQTRSLQIEGNRIVSDDVIKKEIQYYKSSGNSLILLFLNRKTDVSDNNMIDRIDVELANPWTVRVIVQEQNVVCSVSTGKSYIYVNSGGSVVSVSPSEDYDLPVVHDLEVQDVLVGMRLETADDTALDDVIAIAAKLQEYEVDADMINVLEDHKYSLLKDNVTILLGRNIYMEEKISELGNLQDKLAGLSGVLHLENYDSSKDSIIFTKD